MKEPRHDDERLAALLEGRLEGPERDELLAYLATADEDLYVFAKTAAALREMEEEEAAQARQADEQVKHAPAPRTPPPSIRPGWRRWKAPRVIVLTILAGLVVLGVLTTRGGGAAGDPVRLAANLDGLPAGWTEKREWTPVRGDAERGAAQAGALLTDLAVSVRAGDAEETRFLARSIRERFDQQAAPSSPIRQIEARADERPDVLLPLVRQQTERLMARTDRGYLQLGAWTEAALLAAHDRDVEFFRSRATRTMLGRAARITREHAPARDAVAGVRVARDAVARLPRSAGVNDAPEWSALESSLATLMRAITNPPSVRRQSGAS